mgnify:CR=1 FL=1
MKGRLVGLALLGGCVEEKGSWGRGQYKGQGVGCGEAVVGAGVGEGGAVVSVCQAAWRFQLELFYCSCLLYIWCVWLSVCECVVRSF